jgi:hypothetical protein
MGRVRAAWVGYADVKEHRCAFVASPASYRSSRSAQGRSCRWCPVTLCTCQVFAGWVLCSELEMCAGRPRGFLVVRGSTAEGIVASACANMVPPASAFGPLARIRSGSNLSGHFGYYGITGNGTALSRFRHEVCRSWRKWLARRKRGERYPWERFDRLLERYPLPRSSAIPSVCRHVAKP